MLARLKRVDQVAIVLVRIALLSLVVLAISPLPGRAQKPVTRSSSFAPTPTPSAPTYQLFPTQNIFTFVLLNTTDGRAWQVQYAMGDAVALRLEISTERLSGDSEPRAGRFNLLPTQNMFTFMLIDQDTGRTWQLQWNADPDKRFVQEIR